MLICFRAKMLIRWLMPLSCLCANTVCSCSQLLHSMSRGNKIHLSASIKYVLSQCLICTKTKVQNRQIGCLSEFICRTISWCGCQATQRDSRKWLTPTQKYSAHNSPKNSKFTFLHFSFYSQYLAALTTPNLQCCIGCTVVATDQNSKNWW